MIVRKIPLGTVVWFVSKEAISFTFGILPRVLIPTLGETTMLSDFFWRAVIEEVLFRILREILLQTTKLQSEYVLWICWNSNASWIHKKWHHILILLIQRNGQTEKDKKILDLDYKAYRNSAVQVGLFTKLLHIKMRWKFLSHDDILII